MAIGAPDWTQVTMVKFTPSATDFKELAARLGCPAQYDLRGQAIFIDDFENGLYWCEDLNGGSSTIALSTVISASNSHSVELVAGNTSNDYARLYRQIPYLRPAVYGMEAKITAFSDDIDYIYLAFDYKTITMGYTANLRFNHREHLLEVEQQSGVWYEVTDQCRKSYPFCNPFNYVKIVADTENHNWVRIIFNETEYDVSDIPLFQYARALDPAIAFWIKVENLDTKIAGEYVDDVVITIDEPL